MRVQLLGPVVATVDGTEVTPAGRRERALIALLALQPDTDLTYDVVGAALWDAPPADPAAAARMTVERVRAAIPGLTADEHACRWVLGDHTLDVQAFELAIEEAQELGAPQAIEALDAALDLWRGPAMADVRDLPFARGPVLYLEERRLGAIEERNDLLLQEDRFEDLIEPLRQLVRVHPTRERLYGQLITCLHRARRTEEALAVYAEARASLAAELGIAPSEALQQLEEALLRQESVLRGGGPEPRQPTRVPSPRSPTVGRQVLVSEVSDLLRRPDLRVVTLTGLGGTGKTRVATVVAQRAHEEGRQVHFVQVHDSTTTDRLVVDLVEVLGGDSHSDPWEALSALGSDERPLVVLDNAESLVGIAAFVRRFVDSCDMVDLLVTSRIRLNVVAEHEVVVPPLDLPAAGTSDDQIVSSAAVELFLSTTSHAAPAFRLAGHEQTVASLCRLLDGVPLAIELAAARVKVLGVERLLASLQQDLGLLSTNDADVPERHRTLQLTIAWSHQRLSPRAQEVCQRLAVFEGGFTLESVEAVSSDLAPVVEELTSIMESGLIRSYESQVEFAFRMPTTVRSYLREQWEGTIAQARARDALLHHLTSLMVSWSHDLVGPDSSLALGRFGDEAEDVLAIAHWAATSGRVAQGVDLVVAADAFWIASGRLTEALDLSRSMLARTGPGTREAGAMSLFEGRMAYHLTRMPEAGEALRRAHGIGVALGDELIITEAACYLGGTLLMSNELDEGTALVTSALASARRLALYPLASVAMSMVAISRGIIGDFAGEAEMHRERLDLVRSHGDLPRTADALNTLAEIALDESDHETAEAYAQESLVISGSALPLERRDATITLARASTAGGKTSQAASLLRRALSEANATGQSLALAQCLRIGGCLAAGQGRSGDAVRLFAAAHALSPSPNGTDTPVELDFASTLAEARAGLTPAAAQREWTLGCALPPASVWALLDVALDAAEDQGA